MICARLVILIPLSCVIILIEMFCDRKAIVAKNENRDETADQHTNMSLCVRKPTICLCENKDADQLRGNREADQHLCFRYTDSTVPLLLKSKISSL